MGQQGRQLEKKKGGGCGSEFEPSRVPVSYSLQELEKLPRSDSILEQAQTL